MATEQPTADPQTIVAKIRQWLTLVMAILAAISGTTVARFQCAAPISPPTSSPISPPSNPSPGGKGEPNPTEKNSEPDTNAAIGKIQLGNFGCTATIIGKRRADGRHNILTAHHCTAGAPREGAMNLPDGTTFRITFISSDPRSDHAWFATTLPGDPLPYALLADAIPVAGDKVYHKGFGVDRPGNVERGTVTNGDNGAGQTQFRISVSSGDSGGGIALNASGRVLSPVCCTTAKGQIADVWGATCVECKKTMPAISPAFDEWTPIDIPIRMPN